MAAFFYDIEAVPNYTSFFFYCMDGREFLFEIYEDRNDIPILINFLNDPAVDVLISYNGHEYDDLILQWIRTNKNKLENAKLVNQRIKILSDSIISDALSFDVKKKIRKTMYRYKLPFISIDLKRLHKLDNVSLKRIMIILQMDNVMEYNSPDITINNVDRVKALIEKYSTDQLSMVNAFKGNSFVKEYNKLHHFEKLVLPEHVEDMRTYNKHDTIALKRLYEESEEEIALRMGMSVSFNFPINKVISLSRSAAGERLLIKFYEEASKEKPKDFTNRSTISEPFYLYEIIDKNIKFETDILKSKLVEIKNTTVTEGKKAEFKLLFDNTTYDIKSGGLHSKDKPGVMISNENEIIRDADVGSYYPKLMINRTISPRHLNGKAFITMLSEVMGKRLNLKKQYKNKLKQGKEDKSLQIMSDGLKIAINAIFGKLGEIGRWLYDLKALYSVTINGQLYLLRLIEMLYMEGIHTISANTDGIVCKVPKEKEETYYRVCKEWEEEFDFNLEFTDYDIYARRDVNNYICVLDKSKGDVKGNVKTKGIFNKKLVLTKGYKHPIVAKAIYNYILKNKPILETLDESDNIHDFCISVNVGRQFFMEEIDQLKAESRRVQSINRYFPSLGSKRLDKVYKDPKPNAKGITIERISVLKDSAVEVINVIEDKDPKKYNINKKYYIKEIRSVISTMENVQTELKLF